MKFSSINSKSLYLLTPNKNVCCKVVGDLFGNRGRKPPVSVFTG